MLTVLCTALFSNVPARDWQKAHLSGFCSVAFQKCILALKVIIALFARAAWLECPTTQCLDADALVCIKELPTFQIRICACVALAALLPDLSAGRSFFNYPARCVNYLFCHLRNLKDGL